MPDDPPRSNWRDAIGKSDLQVLAEIIRLVVEHELQYGHVITPTQLKRALERNDD